MIFGVYSAARKDVHSAGEGCLGRAAQHEDFKALLGRPHKDDRRSRSNRLYFCHGTHVGTHFGTQEENVTGMLWGPEIKFEASQTGGAEVFR